MDEAAEGNDAIQRVRDEGIPYACMFVDLNLGDDGPDGVETIRALREVGFANKIVGLVDDLDSLAAERLWEAAWEAGASTVMVKGARGNAQTAVELVLTAIAESAAKHVEHKQDAVLATNLPQLTALTDAATGGQDDRVSSRSLSAPIDLLSIIGRGAGDEEDDRIRATIASPPLTIDLEASIDQFCGGNEELDASVFWAVLANTAIPNIRDLFEVLKDSSQTPEGTLHCLQSYTPAREQMYSASNGLC